MTWSCYGQLLAFTDCSGYQTRYEYDRFGQMTAVHREEGISLYRHYDNRGRLTSVKDAQGRETQYEYNAAGDLTAVITPDGNRSETQYDAWGKAVSTTQGGLTRSMEYDAAGRVISLTNENGSHSDFSYDALDRLVQQGGFDGRTQRYHYDLTGKLTQSEDEGLVTLWYYDESDRITHRTVNGEPAEQWQYDDHGWLTDISHLSEGHRVAVHYGYDDKGRLTGERQTVENPETGELLWQHETKHAYNEQGLANRVTPDSLPPVEWLTYGSGYLAGMKLGDTPLLEYTRDRMHRETVRSFGSMAGSNAAYKLTSTYTPAGQLQSQHLNSLVYDRDYGWNDNGDLVRISGPRQTREYGYSATGRLESVRTLAPDLDIRIPYATDPAGNRLPDPELHPDSTLTAWPDNRIAEDAHYVYHYDEYGRLTEKTDLIPAGVIRTDDERTHHYHYDSQHRLVFHTRIQHGEPLVESRYLYDPLGRRMAKRVWRRERDLTGWMSLSRKPEETWYGWDGDRLTTVQTDTTRIQTVYQPGSFTPLIRVETENGEREKAQRRSLAEKLQQEGSEDGHGVVFPAELVRLLDRLEEEIRADRVSSESRAWLAQCGLTVEQLARQVEPEYTPARKVHFYHCDHRGLPLALISEDGNTAWRGEYDEWGRLTEKTDLIPAGVIRTDDERTHHYHYDSQHRLVFHTRIQHGEPLVESRYLYDPLGRRMAKRVWRRERDLTGWMSLSRKPEETWYGWDGDRLTTVQTDTTRIQTVYQPGSFTPLIRVETENGEREKAQRRSLAEKLQQEGSEDGHGVVFPAELVRLLDRLEEEIRADRVSSESRAWLAQCGLTVEQLARQVEPEYTPARKVHFYHCDHRGLPLALISEDGNTAWRGEYDEWGNQLNEENPYYLHQPYRLPGQQHDEESGLYYNRNRYYDPLQGRYITQDPIGLAGGWNLYNYPLNPIIRMDPLGLYNLYQLLYDVWHDDSYGTSSIDITGSGDLISLGGHAGLGVAFAKKKGEMLSDICIYATACGHAGIGGGINAAITYSETKSLPTSGVSNLILPT
ncbi:protein rhsD, truncation [Escherichia coli]|nr:protein rhsD, truncation [Escherichia coli]